MSHNKKRNTAFLYEALLREGTKSTLDRDLKTASFIKKIILEFFNPKTELRKELDLYKALDKNCVDSSDAQLYLNEVKNRYDKLDKKKIFNEQSSLINIINRHLGYKIYNTFIPNYKNLATISQIFNDKTPIKSKILLEKTVLQHISNINENKQPLKPINNIVFKVFASKFNEKYTDLLSEQKDLLSRYVNSFSDDGLELKIFLNEELGRLKENVQAALKSQEISSDKNMAEKTKEVQEFLQSFKDAKEITQDMLQKVLKIQQFVHEVSN